MLWTDVLRLDGEKAKAAVVWFDKKLGKLQEKWRFLGKNKNSFDVNYGLFQMPWLYILKK